MIKTQQGISRGGRILLLCSVFVVAACGLVYELVAGAVSSYLMGDAVTQFSLVIGVFLCAMGAGSFLAKFITRELLKIFIEIEIWIALLGGCSSIAMFAMSAFADALFPIFFYSLCALLGILIGIEIPLLIRILQENQDFSESVSHVLALDYAGALAGSFAFPLLALPFLGLSRASVVFGLLNLAVAGGGARLLSGPGRGVIIRLILTGVLLFSALFFSTRLVGFMEDMLYQDSIVYTKTTRYQRIVLTRWRDDIRLYLNGHIQFCSIDEARYHEALVIPVMEASPNPQNILILGGGDGMAAREVLKYDTVKHVVLADIDPAITELARNRPEFVAMNKGALNSPKVSVVNTDAMKFLENTRGFFDVIITDLPDPNSESLSKLYSKSFYALCVRCLSQEGLLVTQATSPFFAPDAFWCIVKTIRESVSGHPIVSEIFTAPYHVNVPSFGEWGFVLAGKRKIILKTLSPSVPTRFLNSETLYAMFSFSRDMQPSEDIQINRMDHPVLYNYYKSGWKKFNK
ncbi:polyamine aminopropyltransferase [Desulfonema magnum]|uniref:Polyamine aminopropyltransferase n=1 Tax=Desulfonema magnum TaxID=45655 RepID=A0A975BRE1_9BACT|nr:polyamine aminopropyltransferase [Desulfonema magnum]QTA90047.1 Polyamine aminopropyltransferase [Desulfonema magnum]